ncbi:tetratricopeptide repeat protein [Dactylosporangium sp. NPDC051541]|uniref:tetratricopeptide repeat protein n=1 Tax=Dactylosporangium sp. NPDC051541 TaxID=3363977 RepID=UPI0037A09FB9
MLLSCAGWRCQRMISISDIPGGNPVARNDPEHYSIKFQICPDCHKSFCDRCVAPKTMLRAAKCRECGGKLVDGSQRQKVNGTAVAPLVQLHDEGYRHGAAGNMPAALGCFDQVVAARPDYVAAHFSRGMALRNLGRHDEAIAAFERAFALDPRNPQSMFDVGSIYAATGDYDRALAAYDRALAAEPRYVGAMVNKMVALLNSGRAQLVPPLAEHALMLEAAGQSADHTPNATGYINGAKGAALLALGHNPQALAAIDQAINDGPDTPDNYRNRATALERLGRAEEAAAARRIAEQLR